MVQFDETSFFGAAFDAGRRGAEVAQKIYDDAETSLASLRYAEENRESLLKWEASRPFTFVHGDYHAKQMFFPTDAGGDFAVIDWQFPFVAPGAWDFARLQGMCMQTTARRSLETKLMSNYVNGLKLEGINDYNQSEFEDDYRFGLLVSQTVVCVSHADTDIEIFKKECDALGVGWQDAMLLRTQTAMEDWGVLDFLRQL
ncbi:MAG: thiamine kinase-like enzyme [Candidatus Azotimanducaceae bacterium]|jgi:thiamine kinase-like enzyme